MQEEMQEGRQEDAAAVSEGLLQARLLHPRLEAHLEALWPTTGRVKKDEVVLESWKHSGVGWGEGWHDGEGPVPAAGYVAARCSDKKRGFAGPAQTRLLRV